MESLNIRYLDRIDHMRFFAAVLLMVHHFRGEINWDGTYSSNALVRLWMENGSTGVSLFLVLTGFLFCLITNSGQKKISYKGYLLNRILRIFPLLLFLVFIVITCSRQVSSPLDILRVITLQLNTGNSYTGWGHEFYPSGPIWTIAVEFQFYIIFPFLVVFLNRFGPKYLFGIVLLMIFTRYNIAVLKGGEIYYNLYHTMIGRLDQFAIGMLFGHAYRLGHFKFLKKWKFTLPILFISLIILTFLFAHKKTTVEFSTLSFSVEALCWAMIAMCYMNANLPNINIINVALSYLGMTSFSMYLLHLPVGMMFNKLMGWGEPTSVSGSLLESVLRIIVITLVSFFTFYVIEKPFMSLRVKYTK